MPILQLDPDKPLGRKMQQLQTLFYLLLGVPLVVFLVAYLQAEQPGYTARLNASFGLHLAFWLVGVLLSYWAWQHYNRQVKTGNPSARLTDKFAHYRRTSLVSYVVLSGTMLLVAGGLWLTGTVFLGALFSLILIAMAALRPTAEQFIEHMHLSTEEQAQLLHQE